MWIMLVPESILQRWFLAIWVGSVCVMAGCGRMGPTEYEVYKRRHDTFAEAIAAAGGKASREGKSMHGFTMMGWLINLSGANVTDELIDKIIAIAQRDAVFELNLSNTKITDAQLKRLDDGKVLQKTVSLNLENTAITDAGLDQLSNFCALTFLNLKGTKASKEGAQRMGERKIANPQTPPPFKKQPELEI
jgi:hypothetical protein